jgi:hypothetical protein
MKARPPPIEGNRLLFGQFGRILDVHRLATDHRAAAFSLPVVGFR